MNRPILERECEIAHLGTAAREATGGNGSIVLITGEAGIGKSRLVDSIRSVLPAEGRLLVGYCDDLTTPRVLGPLRDLIGSIGTRLTQALESGDHSKVIDSLRAELDWPGHPTVLVVEDVHWADEATLDVLRFLVRRVASLPVVLVLTYRDDEVARDHPLHQLIGLASGGLQRLRLARLSAEAVRRLGADSGMDTDQVYELTSGNPFFVAEVLASRDVGGVPPTIAEAVRARVSELDAATQDGLEQLAVIPSAAERWLVEAVVPGGLAALAAGERQGVLAVSQNRVAFRHELARRAVVDSMPAGRRMACNQAVLGALLERQGSQDLSRILHHAAEAGDDAVVVRLGPRAALEAVAAGSHREAVAHYGRVLDHRAAFPTSERAELLEQYSVECYTIGAGDLAVQAQEDAVLLRRELGDARRLGTALRWLSRTYWWAGAHPEAEACSAEAIEVLAGAGDQRALALALSNQSQLHALAGRCPDGIAVGQRAATMAREIGDPAILSHALNNVGISYWQGGDSAQGRTIMAESLTVALDAHDVEHACRAYANTVFNLIGDVQLDDATRLLAEAIELAEEGELFGLLRYLHVELGMVHLARGAWDEAEREASWGLDAEPHIRNPAFIMLGRLRIRRGQEGGADLIEQAWEIGQRLGDAQRIGPAASALAEAAWLNGDISTVAPILAAVYDDIQRFGHGYIAAELGYWMHVAGAPALAPPSEHPYDLLAAGRWREAADVWQRAGCGYEYANALLQSSDPNDLGRALATLDTTGAQPLARRVRLRMRELGIARIPRGPAPTTRDNPAGLTDRQVEVVRLLAEGLTNPEIATRLVLSVRTVDSHVAAILEKLDARTRRDAVARANTLGILAGNG